jgi:hypothetical protein
MNRQLRRFGYGSASESHNPAGFRTAVTSLLGNCPVDPFHEHCAPIRIVPERLTSDFLALATRCQKLVKHVEIPFPSVPTGHSALFQQVPVYIGAHNSAVSVEKDPDEFPLIRMKAD